MLRIVSEAEAPPFDNSREKLLKASLPNVYHGKSHMECYNIYQ